MVVTHKKQYGEEEWNKEVTINKSTIMVSSQKDKTLKRNVMLRFAFSKMKTKAYSYMETYIQTYIEHHFSYLSVSQCHLKSDTEANKIINSGCLHWIKSRMGRQVNNSVLQNK